MRVRDQKPFRSPEEKEALKSNENYIFTYMRSIYPGDQKAPIFTLLSISTFSPCSADRWAQGAKMKYEIVLLPGYKPPSKLEFNDMNSIWYTKKIEQPIVVWDGPDPYRLYELITECFDPYSEMSDFIKVVDADTGEYIEDIRTPLILEGRPRRTYDGGMIDYARLYERALHLKRVYNYYDSLFHKGKEFKDMDERRKFHGTLFTLKQSMLYGRSRVNDGGRYDTLIQMKEECVTRNFCKKARSKPWLKAEGLEFGYVRHTLALREKPEWFSMKSRMDWMIEQDQLPTRAHVVAHKSKFSIPMSDEEKEILELMRENESKMTRLEKVDLAFYGASIIREIEDEKRLKKKREMAGEGHQDIKVTEGVQKKIPDTVKPSLWSRFMKR